MWKNYNQLYEDELRFVNSKALSMNHLDYLNPQQTVVVGMNIGKGEESGGSSPTIEQVVYGVQSGLFITWSKGSSSKQIVLEQTTFHCKQLHEEDYEDVGFEQESQKNISQMSHGGSLTFNHSGGPFDRASRKNLTKQSQDSLLDNDAQIIALEKAIKRAKQEVKFKALKDKFNPSSLLGSNQYCFRPPRFATFNFYCIGHFREIQSFKILNLNYDVEYTGKEMGFMNSQYLCLHSTLHSRSDSFSTPKGILSRFQSQLAIRNQFQNPCLKNSLVVLKKWMLVRMEFQLDWSKR